MALWKRLRRLFSKKEVPKPASFSVIFNKFQRILELNNRVLELMADLSDKSGGDYFFDQHYIQTVSQEIADLVYRLIYNLDTIASGKYSELYKVFRRIHNEIEEELAGRLVIPESEFVLPLDRITVDYADVVGNKNANLAVLANLLDVKVPDGFAVTTRAFQVFMEYNGLWERLQAVSEDCLDETVPVSKEAISEFRSGILNGKIPPQLQKAIEQEVERIARSVGSKQIRFAVRSSALGEDAEHTFAGQYESYLNIRPEHLLDRYKAVLASTYEAGAVEYRRLKGFCEGEVAMAVGCHVMVDAQASGVLYTLDPQQPDREVMVLTAAWGFGAPVVAGEISADHYTVDRVPPHRTLRENIVRKAEMLVPLEDGGTTMKPVPESLRKEPCLTPDQIRRLAEIGLMVERYFKKPQDIEWALNREGEIVVLQTRSLNIKPYVDRMVQNISSLLKGVPVIFSDRGIIVQNGIAAGEVFVVETDEDLDRFPQEAILVARQTSPRLAKVIRRASGIITDVGSPTGHMATVAREFRVPTVVNTGVATKLLRTGQEITLDATENVVYQGRVKELCYYAFTEQTFEETYEYRLLRRIMKKVIPLNLLDPSDKNFSPRACRTFHDITRFVHEKAVEELIDLNYYRAQDTQTPARKLDLDIPLGLVLIDIGGGLNPEEEGDAVTLDGIVSVPMRAFLEGLREPGRWDTEPLSVDFKGFMSSLTKTFSSTVASPKYVGQNLAVVSEHYANISLRLGYHFTLIDAYISENINDNYAYFRFLGGVTEMERRSRRAKFIAEVLASYDFRVEVRGDLVVARIKKLERSQMKELLRVLGRLVGFTRQLDLKMVDDHVVTEYKEAFLLESPKG